MPIKPAAKPLAHAYAHRDCEYDPPLWRSLEAGFPFIEADVYSFFGRTLVAHDLQQLRPWRTLQKLYLDPLRHYLQHQKSLFADKRPLRLSSGKKRGYRCVDYTWTGFSATSS